MEILILIIAVIVVLMIGYKQLSKSLRRKKALKLGRIHIHRDFPDVKSEKLFDIHVAGFKYYKKAGPPDANDILMMVRDRNNKYDADAIQFLNLQGKQIGHMPSDYNQDIAEQMDQGDGFFAKVRKSIPRDNGREILVTIHKTVE
jgi:hypothetical protein